MRYKHAIEKLRRESEGIREIIEQRESLKMQGEILDDYLEKVTSYEAAILLLEKKSEYEFLEESFLRAMSDIGRYGHKKYGENSYQARREHGDKSRNSPRVTKDALASHALEHYQDYLDGKPHDYFNSMGHDLAAVAFNCMMEFYFAGLENE